MTPHPQLPQTLAAWMPDLAPGADDGTPPWLRQERARAWNRLGTELCPHPGQEGWRYSSPASLLQRRFQVGFAPGLPSVAAAGGPIPGLEATRITLVDGQLRPELSHLEQLPPGVRAASLRRLLAETSDGLASRINRVAGAGAHGFAALNTAGLDDGLVLWVEPGVVLSRPIELLHLAAGDAPRLLQPRHLIHLGEGAEVCLIERYLGPDGRYCTNTVVEIELDPGADLSHQRLQDEGAAAFHLSGIYVRQDAGSRYRSASLALGAAWSRTDLQVQFAGPGAECELDVLTAVGDRQLTDFHLDLHHGVPGCASRTRLRGILHGGGRAVVDGRIRVAPEAAGTAAHLHTAHLLLSQDAEADVKPQLEILTDEVQCSHGASIGQLDPDALFYLRSRGIPEAEARQLLCRGFAQELLDRFGPPALQAHVEARLEERLRAAGKT